MLCVVISVRHAEPALHRLRDIARAVLRVLTGSKIKEGIYADAVQVCDLGQRIPSIFDRVDSVELILQRLRSHRFDRCFVHSAGVIIAYFLCFRRELGIDLRLRGFFGNRVQRIVIALD